MLLNIFRKVYVALLYLLGVISVLFDVFRIVLVALFKKKKDVEVEDSTPRILGTGRADGTYRYRQDFLANKLVEQYPHLSEQEHQTIREVFRKTGTESCTSCWPEELLFKNVGRKEWQKHVVKAHLQMGGEAMEKAITAWGGDRKKITHFIWATHTSSNLMPTEGLWLSSSHGLREEVNLIPMLNVGCCGGFKALTLANDIVRSDPLNHIVLIVDAEACSSLSNAMPDPSVHTEKLEREFLIQAALFRDGASAAIVGSTIARAKKSTVPELAILHSEVCLVPGTMELGVNAHEEDDNVIKIRTIKTIPKLIAIHGLKITAKWIAKFEGSRKEILLFMHPASFNTVNGLVKILGLKSEQAQVSYDCIKTVGNIGGASNLYVMDCWLRDHPEKLSNYRGAVCVAPAAGITIQVMLCKLVHPGEDDDKLTGDAVLDIHKGGTKCADTDTVDTLLEELSSEEEAMSDDSADEPLSYEWFETPKIN